MERINYLDFDLKISGEGGQYTATVLNSPAGQGQVSFKLPFSELELDNLLLRMTPLRSSRRKDSPEMLSARTLGNGLFQSVFQGTVRDCLVQSLAKITDQSGLRIRLRLQEAAELSELPWEFLYDRDNGRFLVQSVYTPVVRYLEFRESIIPLKVTLPLRILCVISNPIDITPTLNVEEERRRLERALKGLTDQGLVKIDWLEQATLNGLRQALRKGVYHVFHFIGHGGFDRRAEQGVIVLTDEYGRRQEVGAETLGALLHDHCSLRLAVLNACEGARSTTADPFAGTAANLVRQGIPAVVAMQFEISDRAACTFADEFYAALAQGDAVDAAQAEARKALLCMPGDNIEWGTPVLYLRSPDGVLFDVSAVPFSAALPPPPTQEVKPARPAAGVKAPLANQTTEKQPAAPQPQVTQPAETEGPPQTVVSPAPARVWVLPDHQQILDHGQEAVYSDEDDRLRANIIEETLKGYGAPVNVVEINRGPSITQFCVEPGFVETRSGRVRVRVGKITALSDDLALALSAQTIRIQAPVPGHSYVGIEVPNNEFRAVSLRGLIESGAYQRLKGPLSFVLGRDVTGNAVVDDLATMPHLLIAGATGSGKSVCINAMLICLLLHNTPDDLRLIMIDPKRVELTGYNGIPHLLTPVVVDMERVNAALQWVLREMDARYITFGKKGVRDLSEYNRLVERSAGQKLPRLLVIIDELADLMMIAPEETERAITRLAQMSRATGIHLVVATQRPSVDVITGLLKANFPARISFAVASGIDSRVILDQPGAERLIGSGDMLFQAPDAPAPLRLQGAYVSNNEIQRLVSYWQGFPMASLVSGQETASSEPSLSTLLQGQEGLWEDFGAQEEDSLLNEAIDLVRRQGSTSISQLQRRLRIGYPRAARLVDTMQEMGIISQERGSNGYQVLDQGDEVSEER
jgi:hypothetical protein